MPTRPLQLLCASIALLVSGCTGPPPIERLPSPAVRPLLLVGVDGATFDRIDPLIGAGRLPNLARLIDGGVRAPLETIEPTLSPAIWTTIATGQLPEVHGILGFGGVPGVSMTSLPTSDMRRVRAFWNILSEHAASVGVVGWWVTYPTEPVNGYIVSDRTTYTRMEAALGDDRSVLGEVYPESLSGLVKALVRDPQSVSDAQVQRFMNLSSDEIERRVRASSYKHGEFLPEFKFVLQSDLSTLDIALTLMASHPTDVTAVAFYGIDTVSHLAWHFSEPAAFPGLTLDPEEIARFGGVVDRYYEAIDEMLGRLIDAAPHGANVIVFSDHGFGPTGRLPWSGGHGTITPGAPLAPDGVLVMSGPAFRRALTIERAHVLDLAPLILHLQGLPLADDMPGRLPQEALAAELVEALPTRSVPTYELGPRARPANFQPDAQFDREHLERWCNLGYIDCPPPSESEAVKP